MGLLSTFFVMADDEIQTVAPGWEFETPRLKKPISRASMNAFAGEPISARSWVNPIQPVADVDAISDPPRRADTVTWKWITEYDLAQLEAAVLGADFDSLLDTPGVPGLIGPENAYGSVHGVRHEVVGQLAAASDETLADWARLWVEERGEEAYPPWEAEDLDTLLASLRELFAGAVTRKARVFLHVGEA